MNSGLRISGGKIKFKYRGAPLSDAQRKELNLKACILIHNIFQDTPVSVKGYEELRQSDYVGYAHFYFVKCYDQSEQETKADIKIYKQLLEIDSQLGTTQTEHLYEVVLYSTRMDIIEV